MIKVSQKAIELPKEEKLFVNENTEVTIPIQVFASMLSALPKINFNEVKEGIIAHLSAQDTNEDFIKCLKSHVEQAEFYMKSKEIVKEFETVLEMREAGKRGCI